MGVPAGVGHSRHSAADEPCGNTRWQVKSRTCLLLDVPPLRNVPAGARAGGSRVRGRTWQERPWGPPRGSGTTQSRQRQLPAARLNKLSLRVRVLTGSRRSSAGRQSRPEGTGPAGELPPAVPPPGRGLLEGRSRERCGPSWSADGVGVENTEERRRGGRQRAFEATSAASPADGAGRFDAPHEASALLSIITTRLMRCAAPDR